MTIEKKVYGDSAELVLNGWMDTLGATELAFSCEKQEGGLCISFFDNGIPFDPTAAGDEKEFEELDSGGMGLRLIRQTVSGMRYERRQNRNELILNFSL